MENNPEASPRCECGREAVEYEVLTECGIVQLYHCEHCETFLPHGVGELDQCPCGQWYASVECCTQCCSCGSIDLDLEEVMLSINTATQIERCQTCGEWQEWEDRIEICDSCGHAFDGTRLSECPTCRSDDDDDDGDDGICDDEGYCGWVLGYGDTRLAGVYGKHEKPSASTLFYGIELEVEARDRTALDEAREYITSLPCEVKSDSSLGRWGVEIALAPMTWSAIVERQVLEHLAGLSARGFASHNGGRCGLHIHTSSKAWGHAAILNAVRLIKLEHSLLLRLARRRSDNYCACPVGDEYAWKKALKTKRAGEGGRPAIYVQPDTIELRLFRGSLRLETLRGALEFTRALHGWAHEHSLSTTPAWRTFHAWCLRSGGCPTLLKEIKHRLG